MFTLLVRFDVRDDDAAAAFDALTAGAVPALLAAEPGTLTYQTHGVEGEPLARVFHEVYRDREAHAEHERRPGTVAFLASLRELVVRTRVESLTEPS